MNANESLIHHFYTSFKNKDIKGMQNCYAGHATFTDPAFRNLDAQQVRSMWEMLIKSSKNMRIEYDHVEAGDHTATAEWTAYYTFSATGKKVVNKVKSSFVLENGKIVSQQDEFNFYRWAKQALGLTGLLLGWTSFLKNKVHKTASDKLRSYMETSSGQTL
ncbi:MAG TPA: nuclear transport factor 2 family protein [Pedobacter sp.]